MRARPEPTPRDEVFSVSEIADAAGVPVARAREALAGNDGIAFRGFLAREDAVHLVRLLRGDLRASGRDRAPLTLPPPPARRSGRGLAASGVAHLAGFLVFLLITSLGLLTANDTDQDVRDPSPVRLVYLMTPGPGGGGGGGGLRMPAPPPPAQRQALKVVKRTSSPVPIVRRTPPPPPRQIERRPPPIDRPRPDPTSIEPPKPAPPAVQAPVVSIPADPVDVQGALNAKPSDIPSNGPGAGGGVGSGTGTGLGEGQGSGIGPGTGGGTGGGPYQPGSGIDPPLLTREVRPAYTDDARRRGIEGDVVLEIVVGRDGRVGNIRVKNSLAAGLDQRAIEAVRQWRFSPARRLGQPVEVIVEVSVEFKLR